MKLGKKGAHNGRWCGSWVMASTSSSGLEVLEVLAARTITRHPIHAPATKASRFSSIATVLESICVGSFFLKLQTLCPNLLNDLTYSLWPKLSLHSMLNKYI